jgi:histidinol-phosphate aminotransferase
MKTPIPLRRPSCRAIREVTDSALPVLSLTRRPPPFACARADVLGVDPDWILCGNGSDDILTIVTRAWWEGQLLRLPYPSYVLYRTLAELQGAHYEEVQFDARLGPGTARLRLRRPAAIGFSPQSQQPVGDRDRPRAGFRNWPSSLPCPLLVDEAYADFAEVSCVELVKENPKVLVSRTLSKSYALAGLRFGFLVAQPPRDAGSWSKSRIRTIATRWRLPPRRPRSATKRGCARTASASSLRGADGGGFPRPGLHVVPSSGKFLWCTHPE